ncbi:MAG TPA: hypothetical protein VHR44_15495, partial [Beijerinckiaceae bacterium]|nr:hypothetical protein [Beijerinckiaceae bacterium]
HQFNPTWAAALGVIYFSNSYASSDDTVKLPNFIRFDAAIYARITENWKAQLNVERTIRFTTSSTFKPGSASETADSAHRALSFRGVLHYNTPVAGWKAQARPRVADLQRRVLDWAV